MVSFKLSKFKIQMINAKKVIISNITKSGNKILKDFFE